MWGKYCQLLCPISSTAPGRRLLFQTPCLAVHKAASSLPLNDQKDFALVSLQLFSGKLETKTKRDESF